MNLWFDFNVEDFEGETIKEIFFNNCELEVHFLSGKRLLVSAFSTVADHPLMSEILDKDENPVTLWIQGDVRAP